MHTDHVGTVHNTGTTSPAPAPAPGIGFDFIVAGSAIFTVSNPAGVHYTFRVTKKPGRGPNDGPVWFVSLLTGPENTTDYTYLGMLDGGTGDVRLTRASKLGDASMPVQVVRWAVRLLRSGKPVPAGYGVRHVGKCGRCARALTVPESIDRGIGPECWSKIEGGI